MNIYMVADWRYGNPMEPGTRAMEAITSVMEGPLCLLVAYAAVTGKIWRHPAQLILTTCQIYGLIWFALHPMFDSSIQHLSTTPFLFFAVAFGLNGPWGIFPPMLWVQSWRKILDSLQESHDPFAHIKEDQESRANFHVEGLPYYCSRVVVGYQSQDHKNTRNLGEYKYT